ncbi:MAG: hypothetical protein ACQEVA_07380 [Myxococcota bacterium]
MRRTRRIGRIVAGIIAVGAVLTMSSPLLLAGGRDSDASRMQARQIEVGSSENDSLSPPDDQIDWRYFKLDERKSVEVSISGAADKAGLEVSLTTATGSKIDSKSASRGSATVEATLDPGIYYFSVSAKGSTKYTASVR